VIEANRYVEEAYDLLFRESPRRSMGYQERRTAVMERWCTAVFTANPYTQMVGRNALCQIGFQWHASPKIPYTLTLVVRRLRKLMPNLREVNVTKNILQDILIGRYPS